MMKAIHVTTATHVSRTAACLLVLLVVLTGACRHSALVARDDVARVQQLRLVNPIPGARVAAPYEERTLPNHRKHSGIDLVAPRGTPVQAAAAGTVELATSQQGHGNLVVINHGVDYKTYYAHLDSITVEEGQLISPAQPIGTVGSTGWATNAHLHFEVWHQDAPTSPHRFVAEW